MTHNLIEFLKDSHSEKVKQSIKEVIEYCRHHEQIKKGEGIKRLNEIHEWGLPDKTYLKMKEAIENPNTPYVITERK